MTFDPTKPLEAHIEANFTYFVDAFTPSRFDLTYSILKAHLLLEELLRDFVMRELRHPEVLNGARLTFTQLVALAKAMTDALDPDSWHWECVITVNKLRNQLAHQLEAPTINHQLDELIDRFHKSLKLPVPDQRLGSGEVVSAHRARAVGLTLLGLYSVLADRLGFDSRARLSADRSHGQALSANRGSNTGSS